MDRSTLVIDPLSLEKLTSNTNTHCAIVENGLFLPEAIQFNYNYQPAELNVKKPVFSTKNLPPLERSVERSNRSAVVILGAPGSGKSSIVHGYFQIAVQSVNYQTLFSDEPFSQALVCNNKCHVALGRYHPLAMRGLDSITDKSADTVQRIIRKAWFDSDIDVLMFEGIHAAYLSIHQTLRALQARFHRDIYIIMLDTDVETAANRVWQRTRGLKYDRKSVKPYQPDFEKSLKFIKKAAKSWENLKIIYRDDDELFLGQSNGKIVDGDYNLDGTFLRSRHMRLIPTHRLTYQQVLEQVLGFVGYPNCNEE